MIQRNFSLSLLRRGALAGLLAASFTVAAAAERVLRIEAPTVVRPKTDLSLVVVASTNGENNEHVSFLQVEGSVDGGKTWTALCYLSNGTRLEKQRVGVTVGSEGTQVLVRARAAFRKEGSPDVDFRGEPIQWNETWDKWGEPPARHVTIAVKNR